MRFWLPLLVAAILPAAPRIVGGPVVVNVTGRSAMVVWVVQTDQLTVRPPTGAAESSPSLHVERATLTGLQPNTRYEYETGGPEGVKGSFKTPPSDAQPFQFVVFGDTRTRNDVHRQVIQAVIKQGIP